MQEVVFFFRGGVEESPDGAGLGKRFVEWLEVGDRHRGQVIATYHASREGLCEHQQSSDGGRNPTGIRVIHPSLPSVGEEEPDWGPGGRGG